MYTQNNNGQEKRQHFEPQELAQELCAAMLQQSQQQQEKLKEKVCIHGSYKYNLNFLMYFRQNYKSIDHCLQHKPNNASSNNLKPIRVTETTFRTIKHQPQCHRHGKH